MLRSLTTQSFPKTTHSRLIEEESCHVYIGDNMLNQDRINAACLKVCKIFYIFAIVVINLRDIRE